MGKPFPTADAKAYLSPPTLSADGGASRDTFDLAVRTLTEYGIVTPNADTLALSTTGQSLRIDEFERFCDLLRNAVLADERNEGLGITREGRGPREFVRALSWFLCRDPFDDPVAFAEVSAAQSQAGNAPLPALPGLTPFANGNRWTRFAYWALALGFAEPAVFGRKGRLIPDCTRAVGRTMRSLWPVGQQIEGREVIAGILRELPVLPGGAYSRALGFAQPENTMSAALSFAVLGAAERGWIELMQPSDAPRDVFALDPDSASGSRRITYIVVLEGLDG